MNLEEYLRKIDFNAAVRTPDLSTLKLLHKQHIMTFPFENLSIHCSERIVMDLEVIFEKLVRSSRGGWCMENNYLFGWVLRQMGFDTTALGARVFCNVDETHFINKVVIDGKAYIADVGFGVSLQVQEPLELVSGKDQPQLPGIFRLMDKGDIWVLEKTCRKPEVLNVDFAQSSLVGKMGTKQIYSFTLTPREPKDFYKVNHRLQTDPTSLFTNKSICSLQTPTGFRALVGWTYTEATYKPEEGVDVFDMRDMKDDELQTTLKEKFNVELKNKLHAVNRKVDYTL